MQGLNLALFALTLWATAGEALACRPSLPMRYEIEKGYEQGYRAVAIACVTETNAARGKDVFGAPLPDGWRGRATIARSLVGESAVNSVAIGSMMCDGREEVARPETGDEWVVYFRQSDRHGSAYPLATARKIDPRLPAPSGICKLGR